MLKVVDLVYYYHKEFDTPEDVVKKHNAALGFANFIGGRLDLSFVKHINYEGQENFFGFPFRFFKSSNKFWHIPDKTHVYLKKLRPDIVIVQGLVFPLQLLMLKLALHKDCRIIVQQHGERPFTGIKGLLQKAAALFTDAYIFTSVDNANEWITRKIIPHSGKCFEILEASTNFNRRDKLESKTKLGLTAATNFLWVGRLDKNKDPLTLLKGFEFHAQNYSGSMLYMIFQEDDLLPEISAAIQESLVLQNRVKLIGKVHHSELPSWYSAADVYISCSWKEGSGYALLEALACGCTAFVTNIPSFKKMTCDGLYGKLFPPGKAENLAALLDDFYNHSNDNSEVIENYFNDRLSFRNIADDIVDLCRAVSGIER